jgi:hypothetical protein
MLVTGESKESVCEFCLAPAAELSFIKTCNRAGIENRLAEARRGNSKNAATLSDALAITIDFFNFSATKGRAGAETEGIDFKT